VIRSAWLAIASIGRRPRRQHDEHAQPDEQHHGDRAERHDQLDLIDGRGDLVEAGACDEGPA
jgi:hypothetical protein